MDRLKRARGLIASGDYSGAMHEYMAIDKRHPDYESALCGIAVVHIAEDRPVDATECMDEVRRVRPEAAYPYGIGGAISEEIGNPIDTMALYEAMLSTDPSEAATYVRKARLLLSVGLEKESAQVVRKCAKVANLKVDTPMAADRLNSIFASVDMGQKPAIRLGDSAVFVPGLRAVLDRAVGDELRGSDQTDWDAVRLGGIDEKNKAVEEMSRQIKPNLDPDTFCVMGTFLYDVGRTYESLACYERAIEQSPGNMQYYGHKLVVLQDAGDDAGIAKCVDKALKTTPNDEYHAKVQKNMRMWRDMWDDDKRNKFVVAGITRSTKWHIARRKHAAPDQAYRSPHANESARGLIRIPPWMIEAADGGAGAARRDEPRGRAGAPPARRPRSKQTAPMPAGPENLDALLARAAKMAADGKPDKTMSEYKKAERQSPLDERVLCGMTLVYMWRGHDNKAHEYVDKLRAVRPDATYLHGITGMRWDEWWMRNVTLACHGFSHGIEGFQWNMHDVPIKEYDKMLAADPGEVSAYVRKALILHFKGMEKECTDTVKACLGARWSGRESPKEKKRLREMGQSIEKNGRVAFKSHDSATFLPGLWEMLDVAFGPDQSSSEQKSDFEGIRLAGEGDLQECLEEAERDIEERPRSAASWYAKGMLLAEGGRIDEAAACYERAGELEPDKMLAYSRRAQLLADEGDAQGALECLNAALSIKPREYKQSRFKDELFDARDWLKAAGRWPPVRSSRIMGDMVRWAAGRRSKLASFGNSDPEGPLFPPGLVGAQMGAGRPGAGRR